MKLETKGKNKPHLRLFIIALLIIMNVFILLKLIL